MPDTPDPPPAPQGEIYKGEADFTGRAFAAYQNFLDMTFPERMNFKGATFKHGAGFSGATFKKGANFEGATFKRGANFEDARFEHSANFARARFEQDANFEGAKFGQGDSSDRASSFTFMDTVSFMDTVFLQVGTFRRAEFGYLICFERAQFKKEALFTRVRFSLLANFNKVVFCDGADFELAIFDLDATFSAARFCGRTTFEGVKIARRANFDRTSFSKSVSLVNIEIGSLTSFNDAEFRYLPPDFSGAKLHEGTTWFGVKWPPILNTRDDARKAVSAYERLKLEMDRLKKHADELDFFALELQARRVLAGKWSSFTGGAIWAYGLLSDYGRSFSKPLFLLLVTALAGADALWGHAGLDYARALSLSAANTLGVFNFRQAFFSADEIAKLPGWLQVFSAGETIAGALLLFLLGLGLRNAFRLR